MYLGGDGGDSAGSGDDLDCTPSPAITAATNSTAAAVAAAATAIAVPVQPHKLELILSEETGTLQTAPLLTVIMACTDSLYHDLYEMAHGELQIIGSSSSAAAGSGSADDTTITTSPMEPGTTPPPAAAPPPGGGGGGPLVVRKEKMSNLSFAQRRHELVHRVASHTKACTHIAALTAANYDTSLERLRGGATHPQNLAHMVDVATSALIHARTAWIQNDECQDELYFFHNSLFSLRRPPHDVYGALDMMCNTTTTTTNNTNNTIPAAITSYWYDLPTDLQLTTDRYETSKEKGWSKQEVQERWSMAVRRKLLLGEVGYMRHQQLASGHPAHVPAPTPLLQEVVPWKISVRGCGLVRLTYGEPKTTMDTSTGTLKTQYPVEAVLTVLTTEDRKQEHKNENENQMTNNETETNNNTDYVEAEWTLISVDVHAQSKTGQSNHQLEPTNQQRYNLHRLCAVAMAKEEGRVRTRISSNRKKQQQQQQQQQQRQKDTDSVNNNEYEHEHGSTVITTTERETGKTILPPARPLNALFRVAQYFSLSLQLEILSEQAKALGKGCWGSNGSSSSSSGGRGGGRNNIVVTPVQFFVEDSNRHDPTMRSTSTSTDNSKKPRRTGNKVLGMMSISFWTVDDRYGPPSMGDLEYCNEEEEEDHEDPDINDKDGDSDIEMTDAQNTATSHNNEENKDAKSTKTNGSNRKRRTKKQGGGGGDDSISMMSRRSSSSSMIRRHINNPAVSNRLTLCVRAEVEAGITVSLSGADAIMDHAMHNNDHNEGGNNNNNNDTTFNHARSTIQDLLQATSNPFALSASEALLAATVLCAERKCYAMVEALTTVALSSSELSSSNINLPSWITLKVEKGSIAVAANIQYYTTEEQSHGKDNNDATKTTTATTSRSSDRPVVLFRLACDSRTGSFVPVFSRSTPLLQYMSCNDMGAASDTTLLRIANFAKHRSTSSSGRSSSKSVAAVFNSGRIVRDSFDSLCRSMNVLGQRTGVGIHSWDDSDESRSPSLRKRAIGLACRDVNVSLINTCGISVLYGLSVVALGVSTGINASPEMCGGKLDLTTDIKKSVATIMPSSSDGIKSDNINDHKSGSGNGSNFQITNDPTFISSFLTAPPPSILLDQKLVDHTSWTADGERKKRSIAEQERFGICCSVNESNLVVYGADIQVELESPSSIPTRTSFQLVPFLVNKNNMIEGGEPSQEKERPRKRVKTDTNNEMTTTTTSNGSGNSKDESSLSDIVTKPKDLLDEVEYFASILSDTIGI